MKATFLLASCLAASLPAAAQFTQAYLDRTASCAGCGVITSIEPRTREIRASPTEGAPSGLVATVPLGSGGGKAQLGPSQKLGREAVVTETDWDVVVKLDDGTYRMLRLDNREDWARDDKVRLEGSRLLRR
jgi:hypothetical protein